MSYLYKQEVKRILYRLKRNYGEEITWYWELATSKNFDTGENTIITDSLTIKRAILMQINAAEKFSYDLTFLAANKNFQYGALYQVGMRFVIIERKDLEDTNLSLFQYCLINGERYDVQSYEDFGPSGCILITVLNSKNRT